MSHNRNRVHIVGLDKHGRAYEQQPPLIADVLHSMFNPTNSFDYNSPYHHLWKKNVSQSTISLLEDYANKTGLKSFYYFHWFRHHAPFVKETLVPALRRLNSPSGEDILNCIKNTLDTYDEKVKKDGSLQRRLDFITKKLTHGSGFEFETYKAWEAGVINEKNNRSQARF